ncbi:hypothetical protein U875_08735 [Pandoraea pnomenusa 3kgm]|nr:hypothetical protein U875_08735 [Pandoraea pnomenusa 3kgm]
MFVQALIPEAPIEQLNVGILVWFAWFDQEKLRATPVRPGQHRPTAKFLAVVGPNRLRQTAVQCNSIQDARQHVPADGSLPYDRDRFMRRIIDYC